MKNLLITVSLLLSITASATEKKKTFFGNEYNSSEIVTLSTYRFEVNVVKNSPLHKIYLKDKLAFAVSIEHTINTSTNPNMTFKSLQ